MNASDDQTLPLIGRHWRGVGMALLFFATLRLCHFGAPSLLDPASLAAAASLALAVTLNLAIGWWRWRSARPGLSSAW
jgi:hypothetical protein